ncbi:uncharacterized protein F4807DRAFT_417622 [Annulohypoxylon truncatum]|uniref:uncharacterized protein n=1 Tax=Annulohypoxylon truncatum TaxID=327061 RepID=UPI0020086532|nr:uncharacterized protein F4807DRAFT_417622 [Annulohypoxylon truncatum]KAI1212126.1 hypothetical protein F4807DRAFT_417622 [Annulohypoxylon truncatum]
MSATRNTESLANQGEFHSRVPPSEPLTTTGHKPGVKVGNDAAPEFHMEKHAPGTAPRENTFQPRPEGETPVDASFDESQHLTNPTDTLGGTTSQAVHTGLGKPVQGQTGTELHGDLHGDHTSRRKKEHAGLEGVGASVGDTVRQKGADLPEGVEKGTRGKASADYPSASERIPTSAEEVAAERKVPQRAYDYTQSGAK